MISEEGRRLARHWQGLGREHLDSYLIQDVEHPAINPQSILVRAFLADRLLPGACAELVSEELLFSACACHALQAHRENKLRELYATVRRAGTGDALPDFLNACLPPHATQSFALETLIADLAKCITLGFEHFTSPFAGRWKECLAQAPSAALSVLELGCGSANDYRFWDAYGLARAIDYVGIDVSEENVRNAKARFPDTSFHVGDACCPDYANRSFDVVFMSDVLEHLSRSAVEAALANAERISRDEIWLALFNAGESAAHRFEAKDDYHWNMLSVAEIGQHLGAVGFSCEILSIAAEMAHRLPGYVHYNPGAYLIVGRREVQSPKFEVRSPNF